jgi:hypothetical protein
MHQWANRIWELQAHVSPSVVTGAPAALIATQRASSRYFQRPDAFRVDSSATSLSATRRGPRLRSAPGCGA